jgi:hypothetical protein
VKATIFYIERSGEGEDVMSIKGVVMELEEIIKRARDLGIKCTCLSKTDLIRTIQIYEGNYPCFGTGDNKCERTDCCWREDCIPTSSEP